ncbi:hypothetical protein C2G38_2087842 [Gigaspora rosea]|uniref:Uncharacterized protein n=1 Tax=Gigaspora rosea TaxID=44941 RepID=A0A397VE92_9GLOM|nr:hypothetical protein C2G38_2087842 [Gigaspora rosea]
MHIAIGAGATKERRHAYSLANLTLLLLMYVHTNVFKWCHLHVKPADHSKPTIKLIKLVRFTCCTYILIRSL